MEIYCHTCKKRLPYENLQRITSKAKLSRFLLEHSIGSDNNHKLETIADYWVTDFMDYPLEFEKITRKEK